GHDRVLQCDRAADDVKAAASAGCVIVIVSSIVSYRDAGERSRAGGAVIVDAAAIIVGIVAADRAVRNCQRSVGSGTDVRDAATVQTCSVAADGTVGDPRGCRDTCAIVVDATARTAPDCASRARAATSGAASGRVSGDVRVGERQRQCAERIDAAAKAGAAVTGSRIRVTA